MQIRGVPFDGARLAACSRVRVFEVRVSSPFIFVKRLVPVGRRTEGEGRVEREKELPQREAGTRNDNRAATKWPRVVTRAFRLSTKKMALCKMFSNGPR